MGCLSILFVWFCICAWIFDDEGVVVFVAFGAPALIAICIFIQDAIEKQQQTLASNTDCSKESVPIPKQPEIHQARYPILPRHETRTFPRSGVFKGYAIIEKGDLIKLNDRIAIYDECGAWIGYLIDYYPIEYKVRKTKKTPVNISIENASDANNAYAKFHS